MPRLPIRPTLIVLGLLLLVVIVGGVLSDLVQERRQMWTHAAAITGGDPARGEAMFIEYCCGSCHGLKHVRKATGTVGPPLDGIAIRTMVAGHLDNSPENVERWIREPQAVSPGTAMPDLNVGQRDARDITAFLYTRAE
ncbi:MAG TPA: c-type cytochrome [Sphingomicrobium sp.]